MVYSKRCINCDKLIDFGSTDPEKDSLSPSELPENAMRFNGDLYCKECVKNFVEFGTGDLQSRIESLEKKMEDVAEALGMQKTLNSE